MAKPSTLNATVPGIPFFSPTHAASPGSALESKASIPTLFSPLSIRGTTLKNRIVVAPMCQYSTAASGPEIGALTPYHIVTLGHYALKGAALVFVEATGVQPNGRISPNCPGLWSDAQIPGLKAVADVIHSQGGLCGIQLAHAGRKGSTVAPFVAGRFGRPSVRATADVGGWPEDVVGPSGGQDFTWDGKGSEDLQGGFYAPRELTIEEIQQMVRDWAAAAERAVKAGVDLIEIHGAHGYLVHQFLSPITNRRTDAYGGSFENRTRLLREIITAVRAVIPESMPLFLRISATEWVDHTDIAKDLGSWDVESSIALSKLVADLGVDLLDVSSGGNHPLQRITAFDSKDYQTKIAGQIRRELRAEGKGMLIGAVGLITQAEQARGIVELGREGVEGARDALEEADIAKEASTAKEMVQAGDGQEAQADVILVARQFMREPEWVLRVAWQLGVLIAWPSQFLRVRFPKL